jgi:hypothetical protein
VLTDVHLGVQAEGPAVRPGTQRALTFGGRTRVTIPPGEEVTSDPVPFAVEALQPLAVSVHVPAPGGRLTRHAFAHQTSYRAPSSAGVVTGQVDGGVWTGTSSDRPLVTGVDVLAGGEASVVAAVGDSLTDGVQAAAGGRDADTRYPDLLARRLARLAHQPRDLGQPRARRWGHGDLEPGPAPGRAPGHRPARPE